MHCPKCGTENLKFVVEYSSNFLTISDAVVQYPVKHIECNACTFKFQMEEHVVEEIEAYKLALKQEVE